MTRLDAMGRHEDGVVARPAPLRILTNLLSLEPIGGIETCTLQDTLALAARGHSIDVMYGVDGNLRSRYASAGVSLSGPVSFGVHSSHPMQSVSQFLASTRAARQWQPDVLWLSRIEHIVWAQSVARWSGAPIVCHLHHRLNFRFTSELCRGVAHFIAVSQFIRDAWIDAGIRSDRISVVDNAVPASDYPVGTLTERSDARRKLGIADDVRVVLSYGRMVEDKGLGTLLEAWSRLAPSGGHAQLLLVGSPSPYEDVAFSQQLGAIDATSVRWFPMQSDMIPFLHAADLVVFPSWLDESFGRVVIESMATGRPVIASRVGAVPEVLSGDMERFLVEPRDAGALAKHIATLLDWRVNEPTLGETCASWERDHYPFDAHVSAIEEILQQNARRRPPR